MSFTQCWRSFSLPHSTFWGLFHQSYFVIRRTSCFPILTLSTFSTLPAPTPLSIISFSFQYRKVDRFFFFNANFWKSEQSIQGVVILQRRELRFREFAGQEEWQSWNWTQSSLSATHLREALWVLEGGHQETGSGGGQRAMTAHLWRAHASLEPYLSHAWSRWPSQPFCDGPGPSLWGCGVTPAQPLSFMFAHGDPEATGHTLLLRQGYRRERQRPSICRSLSALPREKKLTKHLARSNMMISGKNCYEREGER